MDNIFYEYNRKKIMKSDARNDWSMAMKKMAELREDPMKSFRIPKKGTPEHDKMREIFLQLREDRKLKVEKGNFHVSFK
jgi:hypothetical protein